MEVQSLISLRYGSRTSSFIGLAGVPYYNMMSIHPIDLYMHIKSNKTTSRHLLAGINEAN